MMRTFRLSLVTMAVLGTFVSATSAAVTSNSIFGTSTTIEDDVVLTNNNLNWYGHVRRGVSPLRQLNQGTHSGIVS